MRIKNEATELKIQKSNNIIVKVKLITMEESGFKMVIHSIVITAVLYVIMTELLKQSVPVATDRSVLLGTIVLAYMILFGHSFPPGKINPNIF